MTSFPEILQHPAAFQVKRRRNEQAYVMDAHRRLRRLGVACKWEAALLGRSVDLAFFHDGLINTVEFKLKDWRRGLEQARDHQLGADLAYICIPGKRPPEEIIELAVDFGIGILLFRDDSEWPFTIAIPAKPSPTQWPVARDRLLNLMHIPCHG